VSITSQLLYLTAGFGSAAVSSVSQ